MSEVDFVDPENYSYGNKGFTFKDIVLRQFRRIGELACVEFRGGFFNKTPNGEIYVPDSREMYSNAIDALSDMLCSRFDKEMEDIENEVVKNEEKMIEDLSGKFTLKGLKGEYREMNEVSNELFRKEKLKLSRKLFRGLASFLHRNKYLEVGELEN